MKSLHHGSIIIALMIMVVSIACAGEQGPAGAQGAAGPAGPQGEPGQAGPSGFEALQVLQVEGYVDTVTPIFQEARDGWNAANAEYPSFYDISEPDVAIRRAELDNEWIEKYLGVLSGVGEPPVGLKEAHNNHLAATSDKLAFYQGRRDAVVDAGADFDMVELQNDPLLGVVLYDKIVNTWLRTCSELKTAARKTVVSTSFAFCP